jgi:hypothetical protein
MWACSLEDTYWYSRGICCLHFQGKRIMGVCGKAVWIQGVGLLDKVSEQANKRKRMPNVEPYKASTLELDSHTAPFSVDSTFILKMEAASYSETSENVSGNMAPHATFIVTAVRTPISLTGNWKC